MKVLHGEKGLNNERFDLILNDIGTYLLNNVSPTVINGGKLLCQYVVQVMVSHHCWSLAEITMAGKS